MSYTISISEVINNVEIANTPYTVSISEIVNNIAIEIPAANNIAVTNTAFPITISYDATVFASGAGGIQHIIEDATPQLGADLDVLARKITTSVTNGNVVIDPNGTGKVVISGPSELNGDIAVNGIIDMVSGYIWDSSDNLGVKIYTGNNGLKIGGYPDLSTDATFFSDEGFNFNAGDGSSIVINSGVAVGGIALTPAGTGDVFLYTDTVRVGDTNSPATITTNGTGNLTLSTNNGTASGTIAIANGANGNITITPNGTGDVILSADRVQVGDLNSSATVTTNGTGNLLLNTDNGNNTGSIQITNGVNGNISIVPNGTGKVLLKNTYWPAADGSSGYLLATNGAGQASWTSPSGLGFSTTNTLYSVSAETIAGGANIRLTGTNDVTDDVKIASGTNVTVTRTDADTITISAETGTYTFLSESTPSSPELSDHWFNPANQVLQVYTESGWLTVSADDLQF